MHHRPRPDGPADVPRRAPRGEPARGAFVPGALARAGLCASLAACGLVQAVLVHALAPSTQGRLSLLLHAFYAPATAALVVALARAERASPAPRRAAAALVLGGFVAAVVLGQTAMHAFLNSGDEYGYDYLADTLLRGRLWNEPLPDDLRDVFKTFWIAERDGKRVSQYAPGWPVVLAGFKLAGLAEFANPALGLLGAVLLWLCLRRVPAAPGARVAALALGALAPFTVFNNASFFAHTLTATALLAVVWLDLRDTEAPSAWNRAGIGSAFSVLLVTRYEAFLIAVALFALDAVSRKRARVAAWAWPAAVAGAPLAAALLWYNWRITGDPLRTTLSWATPWITYGPYSTGMDGPHSPMRGLANTLGWAMGWHDFASVLALPLYGAALWRRIGSGAVRWFDLLLPAFVAFFFFFPDYGGFQYGPRYWYLGHAALPVTIAAGLAATDGLWRLGRWSLDPVRLAAAQLCAFAGFAAGYATVLHHRTDLRLTPSRLAATAPVPAVVLLGVEQVPYLAWQREPHVLLPPDFTRNGVDGFGPVVVGIHGDERRTAALCERMPDRRIFRLVLRGPPAAGHLERVCN